MRSSGERTLTVIALAVLVACGTPRPSLFTDPRAGEALRAELARYPTGPVAEVHRVWNQYIASRAGSFGCWLSEFWVASEQVPRTRPDGIPLSPCFDHAGGLVPSGQQHEVLSIEEVQGATAPEYRITTRFRPKVPTANDSRRLTSLVTVFAVRESGSWKLAGALSRLTRSWHRETVGPFTYIVRPGHKFSRARAEQAVAFADSVADALGVPRIGPTDYYMVRDGAEMMRIVGYEPDTNYGTPGGRALGGMIISGDTVFGEKHGHEIAHHLLVPLVGRQLHIAASEGVPTWIGGTRSREYREALQALRAHLVSQPSSTLDTVIASNVNEMHNPGAALLAAMVFEHGGVAAIRQFLDSGPSLDEFKSGVARILGTSWPAVSAEWKRRALARPVL